MAGTAVGGMVLATVVVVVVVIVLVLVLISRRASNKTLDSIPRQAEVSYCRLLSSLLPLYLLYLSRPIVLVV